MSDTCENILLTDFAAKLLTLFLNYFHKFPIDKVSRGTASNSFTILIIWCIKISYFSNISEEFFESNYCDVFGECHLNNEEKNILTILSCPCFHNHLWTRHSNVLYLSKFQTFRLFEKRYVIFSNVRIFPATLCNFSSL